MWYLKWQKVNSIRVTKLYFNLSTQEAFRQTEVFASYYFKLIEESFVLNLFD